MKLTEIAPGVIYMDNDQLIEEEEKEYNPESFMAFDNIEFSSIDLFLNYVKKDIIENKVFKAPVIFEPDLVTTKPGSTGAFLRIRFHNIQLNLKIPPRYNILNIEREQLYISLFVNGHTWDMDLPINNFNEMVQLLRGFI